MEWIAVAVAAWVLLPLPVAVVAGRVLHRGLARGAEPDETRARMHLVG